MRMAISKERRTNERRVAASPDMVKKYRGLGLEMVVETGASDGASIPDKAFRCRCGDRSGRRFRLCRRRYRAEGATSDDLRRRKRRTRADEARRGADRHPEPLCQPRQAAGLCRGGHYRAGDGTGAAHHPRAVHGRAVQSGQSGGIPGGGECGVGVASQRLRIGCSLLLSNSMRHLLFLPAAWTCMDASLRGKLERSLFKLTPVFSLSLTHILLDRLRL